MFENYVGISHHLNDHLYNIFYYFQIVQKAVYRAIGNYLGRRNKFQHLHVFPDNQIPEKIKANISNQIKQLRPVPVRLDHISQEELENFPQLLKLPDTYVLK